MMQEWIWQQFGLQVPDTWEMLQFSKGRAQGTCAFADRQMFRLEMSWREFSDWPDFERMLDDYQKKLVAEQKMSEFESVTHGAWHGFHCRGASGRSSRFGRYFEANSKLVELVFLWGDEVDTKELKEILGSFKLQLPKDGKQQWRAFGMNLYTDADMILSKCLVQPAHVSMTFIDKEQRANRKDVYERLGMIDEWLNCDVDVWLMTKKPRYVSEVKITKKSHAHHRIFTASAPAPAINFPRFNKRKNRFISAAWICPDDGRLYHVSRLFPESESSGRTPAGERLSCCERLCIGTRV